jgi:hypothetical protein
LSCFFLCSLRPNFRTMGFGYQASDGCNQTVGHQPHKSCIHAQKGIIIGQDQTEDDAESDHQTGKNSCPRHAPPEKPHNNSGKKLGDSVVAENEQIDQFVGKKNGEDQCESHDGNHHQSKPWD